MKFAFPQFVAGQKRQYRLLVLNYALAGWNYFDCRRFALGVSPVCDLGDWALLLTFVFYVLRP